MTPAPVLRAIGLRRSFDKSVAVDGLDLELAPGSVYGLIGPNGAGKSTTIRMLLGLLEPTSGSSTVFGEDSMSLSPATRRRIGYLSETPFFEYDLPLHDLARYVAGFFDHWDWQRVERLCDSLGLDREKPLYEMSAGQRRCAELVLTLAPDPDLLILDDPTAGLDATVRRSFLRGALEAARDEGKTVVLSSHVLQDLERVIDHVLMLRGGKLEIDAPLDELQQRVRRIVFENRSDAPPAVRGECARRRMGRDWVVETAQFDAELATQLDAQPGTRVETLGLEDIFCALADQAEGRESVL